MNSTSRWRATSCPTTVGREDGPFGIGSLQWWVDDNEEDHYFTLREHPEFHDWFGELAAFDVVANNADRKAGHVLYDGERCWAIDNGLCFHEQDKLRTVIWEYAGLDVNAHLLERLESLRERRDRVTSASGSTRSSWRSRRHRAHGLVENATYPVPDEDSDWPPYPWPLI